eukprot:m.784617 g.784617  ORF g.784617 m.784617 type:complete len:172 (+) comp23300_c0_seq6:1221-1736(+)
MKSQRCERNLHGVTSRNACKHAWWLNSRSLQIILFDGNGTLHPRHFGVACHLGVECDIPTIGVAKTLLACNGIPGEKDVREMCAQHLKTKGDKLPMTEADGHVSGYAVLPTAKGSRPIYISGGHRVSLDTAVEVVLQCCIHKIPEPIRHADLGSRDYIRKLQEQRRHGNAS